MKFFKQMDTSMWEALRYGVISLLISLVFIGLGIYTFTTYPTLSEILLIIGALILALVYSLFSTAWPTEYVKMSWGFGEVTIPRDMTKIVDGITVIDMEYFIVGEACIIQGGALRGSAPILNKKYERNY